MNVREVTSLRFGGTAGVRIPMTATQVKVARARPRRILLNRHALNAQGALPFVRSWELDPLDDPRLNGCGQEAFQRRLEQRFVALTAGLSDVVGILSEYRTKLADLSSTITQIETAVKARSVLDDEVRRYRSAELKTEILQPIFLTVIGMLDRLSTEEAQIKRFLPQVDDSPHALTHEALTWVRDARELDKTDLRTLLARFGVEWYRSARGESFDPKRHTGIAFEDTDNPRRLGRIAQHCRHGYLRRSDDWVILPERVVVFRITR